MVHYLSIPNSADMENQNSIDGKESGSRKAQEAVYCMANGDTIEAKNREELSRPPPKRRRLCRPEADDVVSSEGEDTLVADPMTPSEDGDSMDMSQE